MRLSATMAPSWTESRRRIRGTGEAIPSLVPLEYTATLAMEPCRASSTRLRRAFDETAELRLRRRDVPLPGDSPSGMPSRSCARRLVEGEEWRGLAPCEADRRRLNDPTRTGRARVGEAWGEARRTRLV